MGIENKDKAARAKLGCFLNKLTKILVKSFKIIKLS